MSGDFQSQHHLSMLRRYRSLLTVSEAIAGQRDLASLFKSLAEQLCAVAEFDAVVTVLYDPSSDLMRVQMRESKLLENIPLPAGLPVEACASGWVWQTQQPLIIADLEQE